MRGIFSQKATLLFLVNSLINNVINLDA